MEYRTVGVGGDFADWSAAWIWLCTIDPLGDDYEFEQISDCTINNTWPATAGVPANQIIFNGYSIRFYCPWENSHQGNPTKGFRTYVNGGNGQLDIVGNTSVINQDRFYIENLYIEQTTNDNITLLRLYMETGGLGNGLNFYVNNMLIKGFSTVGATGVSCPAHDSIYKVSNCKIWNMRVGFIGTSDGTGGALPPDNRVEPNTLENITIYNTSNGTGGIHLRGISSQQRIFEVRNVVSCLNSAGFSWPHAAGAIFSSVTNWIYNCADDDNSIAIVVAAGFNNASDTVPNIVAANEFASLVDTETDFLDLIWGLASLNAAGVPVEGKAPLDVRFNADILFSGGAESLGRAGIAPTIQDTDISGRPIPGYDDAYSIGAQEQAYTNFPE